MSGPDRGPGAGGAAPPWFETGVRVRSYELDAFGHVNHAVYLNYFEEARIRVMEEVGQPVPELLDRGWGVHVVRLEVEYRKEAHMGDELRIRTRVDGVRRSSMTVLQRAVRAGPDGAELVCEARVTWVWVNEDGRPVRVPDPVREALLEARSS